MSLFQPVWSPIAFRHSYFIIYINIEIKSLEHTSYFTNLRSRRESPNQVPAAQPAAAERARTTAHSFILEAIAEKADQAERRADCHDVAEKRYADLVTSGKTISWEKMRSYLENRIAGKTVARPKGEKLAR